jgi:hypothetical protein
LLMMPCQRWRRVFTIRIPDPASPEIDCRDVSQRQLRTVVVLTFSQTTLHMHGALAVMMRGRFGI